MKSLFIALTVFPLMASAVEPIQHPIPKWEWQVKPEVRGSMIIAPQDIKKIYQTANDTVSSVSNINSVADVLQSIGDRVVYLTEMSGEQAALEIVDAAFKLAEVSDRARLAAPNAGATASLLVFPVLSARKQIVNAVGPFTTLSRYVIEGMKNAQEVQRRDPKKADGKWYFLGAVGNVLLSTRGPETQLPNQAHLQLVLGLKPQVQMQGENKIEILGSKYSKDDPIALVDISMPVDFELPKVEVTFGRLGRLKPSFEETSTGMPSDFRMRFEQADDSSFGGCQSYPRITNTMVAPKINKPFDVIVPVFGATMEGNQQRMTTASVGVTTLAKIPTGCTTLFGLANPEFVKKVNNSITDSTFAVIFGMSLNELAESVQRLKQISQAAP